MIGSGSIISNFLLLQEEVNKPDSHVVYECENGKRMVVRDKATGYCIPVDKNGNIVSYDTSDEDQAFYKDTMSLLTSYFNDADSIPIYNIYTFQNPRDAFDWLQI